MCLTLSSCQSWLPVTQIETQPIPTAETVQSTPPSRTPEEAADATPSTQALTIWVPPSIYPDDDALTAQLFADHLSTFSQHIPGTQINVRIKAATGAGGIMESLIAASAVAPAAMPSLVALQRQDMETAALKGLLFPLDGSTTALQDSDWYDYARQLAQIQNVSFGLPFGADALLIAVRSNKPIQPSNDWNSLLNQNQPLLFPAADPQALLTLQLYLSAGGSLTNETGQPALEPEILSNVLTLYANGAQQGIFPLSLAQYEDYQQTWQAYTEQRFDRLVTWNTFYMANQQPDSNVFLLPSLGEQPFALTTGWLWAVTDPLPERRQTSIRLAEFLVEPGFLSSWTSSRGYVPVRPSSVQSEMGTNTIDILETLARSATIYPTQDIMSSISPVLQEATLSVIRLQYNPEQAAKNAADKLQPPAVQ
ncbi:MAG: extracellular solute-binding protein [Anaerolineae bacterium]|nr:extracellular solute-binding protein [Anaerolineae bacterium]